jgi:predicted dehydrogenase
MGYILENVVKFGVIGCGNAWGFHRVACNGSNLIKFSSIYDINMKAAERAAKSYKANPLTPYSDLPSFLQSDIDAVLILVPHIFHEELVLAAAAAGKHVLLEKPMATTIEGCNQMIDATKKAGIKFMIAENHRFLPAHQYIADIIQQGVLGTIEHVRAYEGVNEIHGLSQAGFWKGDPIKAGGGCLMDMGAHKFATLEWLMQSPISSVQAFLSKQHITLPEKAEDNASAFFQFANGVIGEVAVSFTQVAPPYNTLEIHGTLGSLIENHMWEKPVKIYSNHESLGPQRSLWYEPEIAHGPFPKYYTLSARIEDEYFARCILENRDPEFTPENAKSAIECVLMGYLSVRLQRTVTRSDLNYFIQDHGSKQILADIPNYIIPSLKNNEK